MKYDMGFAMLSFKYIMAIMCLLWRFYGFF